MYPALFSLQEFGARVPRAGSAYVYSFVTVGEAIAWTTGWQLLLEYIIGASTVARAWSGYLDSLSSGAISGFMASHIPAMHVTGLASEVDFLAFSITMLLTLVCAFGAKESSLVNNVLTGTNVLVIGFTIIAGAFYAKPENYTPFAPNPGLIMSGAATSFFAYVGEHAMRSKRIRDKIYDTVLLYQVCRFRCYRYEC